MTGSSIELGDVQNFGRESSKRRRSLNLGCHPTCTCISNNLPSNQTIVWLVVIFGWAAAAFIIALFISVFYLYLPEKRNEITAKCIVDSCTLTYQLCPYTSCSSSTKSTICTTYYYDCYARDINYHLSLNGQEYSATDSTTTTSGDACGGYTDGSAITCYYEDTNPGGTLSLASSGPVGGGIAAVVIFTIFSAVFVLLFVFVLHRLFRN